MFRMIALLSSVRLDTSSLLIYLRPLIEYVLCEALGGLTLTRSLQDQDGALKKAELEEVFSTSPGNPWAIQKFPDTTLSDDAGAVTLQGWLAQWRCVIITLHHS
jgi:hypothetical protein